MVAWLVLRRSLFQKPADFCLQNAEFTFPKSNEESNYDSGSKNNLISQHPKVIGYTGTVLEQSGMYCTVSAHGYSTVQDSTARLMKMVRRLYGVLLFTVLYGGTVP